MPSHLQVHGGYLRDFRGVIIGRLVEHFVFLLVIIAVLILIFLTEDRPPPYPQSGTALGGIINEGTDPAEVSMTSN